MILGWLLIALLLLRNTIGASSLFSFIDSLTGLIGGLFINDTEETGTVVKARQEKDFPKQLEKSMDKLSLETKVEAEQNVETYLLERANEISINPEFADSIENVQSFEEELELLVKGFTHDGKRLDGILDYKEIVMLINQVPGDFKEFISISKEIHAKTILKHLPLTNRWENQQDLFRFLASIYPEYYDEKIWNVARIGWEGNLWAICEADNAALSRRIQKEIKSKDALKTFNAELLLMCCKYDAESIFRFTELNPDDIKPHLELLIANSSAGLLELYQYRTKIEHLHLENYPFPEKSPTDVTSFRFLMRNGHDHFPMSWHITSACKWGRLNILKHLRSLNLALVPTEKDLKLAAEKGWWNILKWALKSNLVEMSLMKDFAVILAINHHFRALNLLLNAGRDIFESELLFEIYVFWPIIEAGKLEALQWIIKKRKITRGEQIWINLAAEGGHALIFKWLYEKFKLSPSIKSLENATAVMLELVQNRDANLITKDLVKHGAGNLDLLQWILKTRPELLNDTEKRYLSRKAQWEWLAEWVLAKKDGLDIEELVSYVRGNLGLLQYAFDKNPNLLNQAEREILLTGKHKAWLEEWEKTKNVNLINEELLVILTRNLKTLQWISDYRQDLLDDRERKYLSKRKHSKWVMQWIHENPKARPPDMNDVYKRDDLEAIKWAKDRWGISPTKKNVCDALGHKSFKILEWLYDKHPDQLDVSKTLGIAVWYGNLNFAEKLMENYTIKEGKLFCISPDIANANWRLEILQWLKKYNLPLELDHEIRQTASKGYSQNFEWLVENYPEKINFLCTWKLAAKYGHQDIYRWLLEKRPNERKNSRMANLCEAIGNGHLEVVKLILKKDPLFAKYSPKINMNSLNYHTLEYFHKFRKGQIKSPWSNMRGECEGRE